MRVSVCRKEHFNAAHRLHVPQWSDEQNRQVFGKCNNPFFHGHNYVVEVKVTGEVDATTGYVIDLKILGDIVREIITGFDHKNLNLDVAAFKHINPTAENIVIVLYNLIKEKLDDRFDLRLRLYETENNFVEYPA